MAGTLVANTINTDTGLFSTNNAYLGVAKAWGSYTGVSSSAPTLRSAFNISSVTRNSTGNYTFAFTTAMTDSNYAVVAGVPVASGSVGVVSINTKTTASFIAVTQYVSTTGGSGTPLDGYNIDFVVSGN
jgi:hypothetical protein